MKIYGWPDGWEVRFSFSERKVRTHEPVAGVFSLRGLEQDDRWFVARIRDSGLFVPWAWGSQGWQVQDIPKGEALRRMLGFLLDVGAPRPSEGGTGGTRGASLVLQHGPGATFPDGTVFVPYPRWVDDVRWEGRYEEADLHVMRKVAEGQWQSTALHEDLFLGHVEELQIYTPEMAGSDGLWNAICEGQTSDTQSPYFHGLVDKFLDEEFLLPISSRKAWEAEHVVHGSWTAPSEDEVEVFQLLGEVIPWLWPLDRLSAWLGEGP